MDELVLAAHLPAPARVKLQSLCVEEEMRLEAREVRRWSLDELKITYL